MRIGFFLLFLLFQTVSFGNVITLKDKLANAKPGSFLVVEQNKTFTFYFIQESGSSIATIEEISIPASRFKEANVNWRGWFEQGAPGHSSWTISYVNLLNGHLEKAYSCTHQGWIDLTHGTPFLTTLLNLNFQQIPDNQRRRVGLPPGYGKPDRRPIWNPRITVDGNPLAIPCTVWKSRWPNDGSELARKLIEVYLPDTNMHPSIPSFFPYWLEVEGRLGSAKIRVVDSGTGAVSPNQKITIKIMGHQIRDDGSLVFFIQSPQGYSEWLLMAENSDSLFGSAILLPCTSFHIKEHIYGIVVSKDTLKEQIHLDNKYRFSISPKEDPATLAEMETDLSFKVL